MNLKKQTSKPIVVTTILSCSPVIANHYWVFLGPWQAFSQLIFTWMRVVWEKWSFQRLCNLPQITLIILPNFQQNCRNLASVLLGVLSFDQFLAFNWFMLHFQFLLAHREPFAIGVTCWTLIQIIFQPLRLDNKIYLI